MTVKLLVADVDGTVLGPDGQLSDATVHAVDCLQDAGIGFTLASARPPLGMRFLFGRLDVTLPAGAFNGGLVVEPRPGLEPRFSLPMPDDVIAPVIAVNEHFGLETWAYVGNHWYASDRRSRWVTAEYGNVRFRPDPRETLDGLAGVVKIAGIGAPGAVQAAEAAMRAELGDRVRAGRSQATELDVTHPDAHKGAFVRWMASARRLELSEIAVIGDGEVDVPMFAEAGVSIAMGNAPGDVKAHAQHVTRANSQDGFARAIGWFVL